MARKSKKRSFSGTRFFGFLTRCVHGFGIGLYFFSKFLPLVLVALLIGGVYHGIQKFLYADPYFRLDVIRVRTDLPFTTRQIERLSGLRLGENLLAVDLVEIAKRIERNPEIKRVEV